MNRSLVFVGVLALSGCVTTPSNVVSIGKDTYQISATSVGFSTQSAANMAALETASAHCAKLGKKMQLQQAAESGVYGFTPRRSDVVFKCLNEDDPAYKQPAVTKPQ